MRRRNSFSTGVDKLQQWILGRRWYGVISPIVLKNVPKQRSAGLKWRKWKSPDAINQLFLKGHLPKYRSQSILPPFFLRFFFFLMWTVFKVFIEFVTILLLFFMFWVFGPEACGILAPRPGVKLTPPALEGKVLTTGPPGKSLNPPLLT